MFIDPSQKVIPLVASDPILDCPELLHRQNSRSRSSTVYIHPFALENVDINDTHQREYKEPPWLRSFHLPCLTGASCPIPLTGSTTYKLRLCLAILKCTTIIQEIFRRTIQVAENHITVVPGNYQVNPFLSVPCPYWMYDSFSIAQWVQPLGPTEMG